MSSELWGDSAMFCRSLQICWPILALGELVCLAGFLTFFGAPANAAIGAGAIEIRTQASQIAPVEQVQSTNGRKKYHWYANGWNGPGYYRTGEAGIPGAPPAPPPSAPKTSTLSGALSPPATYLASPASSPTVSGGLSPSFRTVSGGRPPPMPPPLRTVSGGVPPPLRFTPQIVVPTMHLSR